MRMFLSLALVLAAAAALASWASAGTGRHRAAHGPSSSIAAIADSSTSWAEFSARVPDLPDVLARQSPALRAASH